MGNYAYFITLFVSAVWIIEVLKMSNFEKAFKKQAVWQIKSFYIIITLSFAHLLASFVERIFNLF